MNFDRLGLEIVIVKLKNLNVEFEKRVKLKYLNEYIYIY